MMLAFHAVSVATVVLSVLLAFVMRAELAAAIRHPHFSLGKRQLAKPPYGFLIALSTIIGVVIRWRTSPADPTAVAPPDGANVMIPAILALVAVAAAYRWVFDFYAKMRNDSAILTPPNDVSRDAGFPFFWMMFLLNAAVVLAWGISPQTAQLARLDLEWALVSHAVGLLGAFVFTAFAFACAIRQLRTIWTLGLGCITWVAIMAAVLLIAWRLGYSSKDVLDHGMTADSARVVNIVWNIAALAIFALALACYKRLMSRDAAFWERERAKLQGKRDLWRDLEARLDSEESDLQAQ